MTHVCRPGWQTYIVRASKDMRKNNYEFLWLSVGEGESWSEYLEYVFDEGKFTSVTSEKQALHKITRLIFSAVNVLTYQMFRPTEAPIGERP